MLNSSLKSRVRRLEVLRRDADDYTPLSALVRAAREQLASGGGLQPIDREQQEREADRRALASLTEADEPRGHYGSAAYWRHVMQSIHRARAQRLLRDAHPNAS